MPTDLTIARYHFSDLVTGRDSAITVGGSKLSPYESLAAGHSSNVRLFQDRDGEEQVVVKKALPHRGDLLEEEYELCKLAYPETKLFVKYHIYERLVMPYIKGVIWTDMVKSIVDMKQLYDFLIATVNELIRIHDLGIIHCDLYSHNILVCLEEDSFKTSIIDFGYSVKEKEKTRKMEKTLQTWHLPEEVFSSCSPASRSIDVFSLGKLFYHGKQFLNGLKYPDCIEKFIQQSSTVRPTDRPSLDELKDLLLQGQKSLLDEGEALDRGMEQLSLKPGTK